MGYITSAWTLRCLGHESIDSHPCICFWKSSVLPKAESCGSHRSRGLQREEPGDRCSQTIVSSAMARIRVNWVSRLDPTFSSLTSGLQPPVVCLLCQFFSIAVSEGSQLALRDPDNISLIQGTFGTAKFQCKEGPCTQPFQTQIITSVLFLNSKRQLRRSQSIPQEEKQIPQSQPSMFRNKAKW